jgi:hypothetical protein
MMKPFNSIVPGVVALLLCYAWTPRACAQAPASQASADASARLSPPEREGQPTAASSVPVSPAKRVLPVAFPENRYAALVEKSPFAVATAPPEQVVPTENFATNWVLAGISKQKGKDGAEHYTVFVRSRDLATRLVISDERPSDDGISLVSVDEAPVAAKSTATLRKGSETGRVEFDQAAVAAAAAAPPQAQPGKPGAPAIRNSAKSAPIPRPGMPSGVPRPGASLAAPAAPAAPNAAPAPGAPNQQEPRRRVRPIQDPP